MSGAERQARYRKRHREEINRKKRARYAADPEAEKHRHKAWASTNLEHLRQYEHRRYVTNPEPKKAQARAWRENNPERNALTCLNWQIKQVRPQ